MANIKQIKNKALSTIDAAMAILQKYPNLDVTNINLSANLSTNPIEFLMDALKRTCGYNTLLDILSSFICFGLPALETSVKAVLLTNLKNMLTCSLNPIIPDEVLLNGIVFDLSEIDILDKLRYSPLDKVGKYYYFGCDDCKTADDVRDTCTKRSNILENTLGGAVPQWATNKDGEKSKSRQSSDFDALLWYLKNRGVKREVWSKACEPELSENQKNPEGWVIDLKTSKYKKLKKSCGILTVEYHENSSQLKDAIGNSMAIQTPYYNCLHVFIGNVKEKYNISAKKSENDLDSCISELSALSAEKEKIETAIENINNEIQQSEDNFNNLKITESEWTTQINEYNKQKSENTINLQQVQTEINEKTKLKSKLISTIKSDKQGASYRPLSENYYYRRTLIEFNTDYVMSLRLFDSKVVAAQVLDAVVGLLSININLSYKQRLLRSEIKKMVSMVVQSDDAVVSDCFFSFSNDDYNSMLEKAEMNKLGLFTINGEQNCSTTIDAKSLLSQLNNINSNSTEEEINSIVKGSLETISDELSENEDETVSNFGVKLNFIDNLMNSLAETIVNCVISPKLYLLLAVNLQILGKETNFNLSGFITQFQQLIVDQIRNIRDIIIEYFTNKLMEILGTFSKEIALKLSIEQAEYYTELIKKLIECFSLKNSKVTFNIDNVNYADINDVLSESKNNEC